MKLLNGCMSCMVRARYNYNPGMDSPNENDADVRDTCHNYMLLSHIYISNYMYTCLMSHNFSCELSNNTKLLSSIVLYLVSLVSNLCTYSLPTE